MEPLNVSRRNSVSIHSLECIIYPKKYFHGTAKKVKKCFPGVVYLDCWLDKLGEGFFRQHLIISY